MTQTKSKGGPEDLLQARRNRETVEESSRILLLFLVGEVTNLDDLKGGGVIACHQIHEDEKNVSTFFEPFFRF